jgi:general secretion pathway protein F
MPIFEYQGLSKTGQNVKGIIDSENQKTAKIKLKKDGIYVTQIRDKKKQTQNKNGKTSKKPKEQSVPIADLALMTRQLATLIKANIPLVDALGAISEQVDNPALAEAMADIKNMVNEGSPLFKALNRYPKMFDNIYVSMCEAGEMSGSLDVILLRLSEFTESQNTLKSKVKGALTYPVVMLVVTFALLAFLFVFVVPKIVVVFDSSPELQLPFITEIVINTSNILINYWYVFIIFIVLTITLFKQWKATPTGRRKWHAFQLKAPLFGEMNRMVAVSRFTRTLSTLLVGGVPMLTAMQIVRNVVDNDVIADAIDEARSNISEGESVAIPLKRSNQFPPIVTHMISIGEKTGELETMLLHVSDAFEFQVKNKIETLTGLMGPIVLVFMGLAIGIIVFAVMLPMFELTNLGG